MSSTLCSNTLNTAALSLVLAPIGAGNMRDCFAHPYDTRLVIKVPVNAQGVKICQREQRYIERVTNRFPEADLSRLPRYSGHVMTDHGRGWVQQRVLDDSGEPSPLLRQALDLQRYECERQRWDAALEEFTAWARSLPASLRDLTPSNLCVRRLAGGQLQLVPVDGFSPRAWLHRVLPTRSYAARRNREQLAHFGFVNVPTLIARAAQRSATDLPGRNRTRKTHLLTI